MKITYLNHSSFCLEFKNTILLIDYGTSPRRPIHGTIEEGVFEIDKFLNIDKKLVGYASHRHADHFDEKLIQEFLSNNIPFIFSDEEQFSVKDYMKDENFHRILPQTITEIEGIKIANTGSTDQGGSILFELPELDYSIYYGADLAVWDDLPEFYEGFQKEFDWLAEQKNQFKPTKVVFLPSGTGDGYQEEPLLNGSKELIELLQPEVIIPMHGSAYPEYYPGFAKAMLEKIGQANIEVCTFSSFVETKAVVKNTEPQKTPKIITYTHNPGESIEI